MSEGSFLSEKPLVLKPRLPVRSSLRSYPINSCNNPLAGILVARHLKTADDFFVTPQGSPRTDAMIAAAVQWAERIMQKIDGVFTTRCRLLGTGAARNYKTNSHHFLVSKATGT